MPTGGGVTVAEDIFWGSKRTEEFIRKTTPETHWLSNIWAEGGAALDKDKLFFDQAGVLNKAGVPAWALVMQGIWAAFLVLPRTYDATTKTYGNLYGTLLDYVISAALIFYILTIAGVFRLRFTKPNVERPYKAFGYPVIPALYIIGASTILIVLFIYRPTTTFAGLGIVLSGVPAYFFLERRGR